MIATLGIAVAAASTIAAVADQALLRPLPFRDPSRVLMLWEKSNGGDFRLPAYPTVLDWQPASRAFTDLGYARGRTDFLTTRDGAVRATTAYVSPHFLSALGASPALGRFFLPDEEAAGRGDAVVLSERFWRARFGGDSAAIGTSITLTGRSVTVVGVISTAMSYPLWADMWRPISAVIDTDPALASRHHHTALARLLRASLDTMLYKTSPFAVVPLVTAALLLGCVAVAASWLPARRAGGADPMAALRSE